MAPEGHSIDAKYNVLRVGVISSNSVASRTRPLVQHLNQQETGGKRHIAALHAKAPVANKLISAIEIAKRELLQTGHKVYQYSALSSETVLIRPKSLPNTKDKQQGGDEALSGTATDDESESFEVMASSRKTEEMTILTVYLSLAPIKELRDAHGEQIG